MPNPGKPFHLPFMPIGTVKRAAVHNRIEANILYLKKEVKMAYDFSKLSKNQKESLKHYIQSTLLEIDDKVLVNLYNRILADNDEYPNLYPNNEVEINKRLKDKNIWKILYYLPIGPFYHEKDAWFYIPNNQLYSTNNPKQLFKDSYGSLNKMAELLVEKYADDYDIVALQKVMQQYTAKKEKAQ